MRGEANPRFTVTPLEEHIYCAGGDMPEPHQGNPEQPVPGPHAGKPPCAPISLSSGSPPWPYAPMCALCRIGLKGTLLAKAIADTIRNRRPGERLRAAGCASPWASTCPAKLAFIAPPATTMRHCALMPAHPIASHTGHSPRTKTTPLR